MIPEPLSSRRDDWVDLPKRVVASEQRIYIENIINDLRKEEFKTEMSLSELYQISHTFHFYSNWQIHLCVSFLQLMHMRNAQCVLPLGTKPHQQNDESRNMYFKLYDFIPPRHPLAVRFTFNPQHSNLCFVFRCHAKQTPTITIYMHSLWRIPRENNKTSREMSWWGSLWRCVQLSGIHRARKHRQ